MAGTEGTWRLKLIIGLFLVLTLLYTSYAIFDPATLSARYDQNDPNYNPYEPESGTINESSKLNEDYDYNAEQGNDFIGMIFGFGSFITFAGVGDGMVRLLFNLFTTTCFISIGYVIYSFIRDWVPFV